MKKKISKNIQIPMNVNAIQRIDDELYVGRKGNVHFALERITFKNKSFWTDWVYTQDGKVRGGVKYAIADGTSSFKTSLKMGGFEGNNHLWIAYASTKKITGKAYNSGIQEEGDIEMAFTVWTKTDIPFFTNIGIFRAVEFHRRLPSHKGLSMILHSFSAQAIERAYDGLGLQKDYMITRPAPVMYDIMKAALPQGSIEVGNMREHTKALMKKSLIDAYEKDFDSVPLETLSSAFHWRWGPSSIRTLFEEMTAYESFMKAFGRHTKFYGGTCKAAILDCIRYLTKIEAPYSELNEIVSSIDKGEFLDEEGWKKVDAVIKRGTEKNRAQIQGELVAAMADQKKILQDSLDLYFPKGAKDTSAFDDTNKEGHWVMRLPSGDLVPFERPEFWYHEHLNNHLPMAIIKQKPLASLTTLGRVHFSS
ncbi:MAG: hypothetical protein B7Y25_02570 [Alphaproteobacteria bacterium 16-39-46]|nr:MAG: hypothetical protein B7Y25_02570 [Alphaproteobacteria bacterium 16-39-46]